MKVMLYLVIAMNFCVCPTAIAANADAGFVTDSASAMNVMMTRMKVAATGDADRDFAAMMIPHHQGAIDMAIAELKYGKNVQLRRIAEEIIVTQRQEIDAMHYAIEGGAK
jgi:uncharacterized protein (DUF305 family)